MVRRESEDAPAPKSRNFSLPQGWIECHTTEGKKYYCNLETKQTTWEYPAMVAPLEAAEKARARGGILADDMGMGKTIEVLSLLLTNRPTQDPEFHPEDTELPSKATLIVCPLSLLSQWTQEIERHTPARELSVYVYHGTSRNRDLAFLAKHDIVITTYSTLARGPVGQAGQAHPQGRGERSSAASHSLAPRGAGRGARDQGPRDPHRQGRLCSLR
jgi:SNF2 family DNA or RNA helicase